MPWLKRSIVMVSAILLAACMIETPATEGPPAANGDGVFSIVEAGEGGLIVEADGRRVVVDPPDGYCVDATSVRMEGDTFFLLIGACDLSDVKAGVLALSLGRRPLFAEGRKAALDGLEKLVTTAAGRKGVGMGGESESIAILKTLRTEDTFFVLVEDTGARVAGAFGPRFWRAFTEINGRTAIASLGVDRTSPEADDERLLDLSRLVDAIRNANGEAPPEKLVSRATAAAHAG